MSREKERGATSHAPIPKPVGPYSACEHSATVTERMPEGHAHYASKRCADCGAFICWLPKLETIERRRLNAFKLVKLVMCDRLTSWERHFVRDASQRKRVSPKQQEIIDRLCATYLEEAA
jgi:hypothetical protein